MLLIRLDGIEISYLLPEMKNKTLCLSDLV